MTATNTERVRARIGCRCKWVNTVKSPTSMMALVAPMRQNLMNWRNPVCCHRGCEAVWIKVNSWRMMRGEYNVRLGELYHTFPERAPGILDFEAILQYNSPVVFTIARKFLALVAQRIERQVADL